MVQTLGTQGASFCVPGCGCGYGCIEEIVDPVTDAVATGDAQGRPLTPITNLVMVSSPRTPFAPEVLAAVGALVGSIPGAP